MTPDFIQTLVFHWFPFSVPQCNPGCQMHLSVMSPSSLVCDCLLLFVFMTLTVLESTGQVFYRMSLNWVCLMFSLDWNFKFGERISQGWNALLLLSHQGSQLCDITGGVNCDHLVEMVSATFLHGKVTVFPFANSILWKQVTKFSPPKRCGARGD